MNMPVWCSRYATQLERWLDHFASERVLVLDQARLLSDRAATLRQVLAFLEVDTGFTSASWDAEHNAAPSHRRPRAVVQRLGPRAAAAAQDGKLPRLLTASVPKPTPTPAQRRQLEELFRPEAERLAALTGLRLDHWGL